MSNFLIEAAVTNNKGKIRQNNEDNFYLNGEVLSLERMDDGGTFEHCSSHDGQVYSVCDGMGGEDSGELASYTAVSMLADAVKSGANFFERAKMTALVRKISDTIWKVAKGKDQQSGTTMVMCAIRGGNAVVAHVGDSRAYLFREKKLRRLTKDHSEVQRMVSLGIINEEDARNHPKRNIINQYLGMPSDEVRVEPTFSQAIPLQAGDSLLLCSDGVTDMITDEQIAEAFLSSANMRDASRKIVDQALENGGRDNITALCLQVKKVPPYKRGSKLSRLLLALCGVSAFVSLYLWIELLLRLG